LRLGVRFVSSQWRQLKFQQPNPNSPLQVANRSEADMLANQGQAATTVKLLDPASAANTAAATSAWVDVTKAEGDVVFINQVGALTGSITWTIEEASDAGGTGAAGITPNEGAYASGAANQVQSGRYRLGQVKDSCAVSARSLPVQHW